MFVLAISRISVCEGIADCLLENFLVNIFGMEQMIKIVKIFHSAIIHISLYHCLKLLCD